MLECSVKKLVHTKSTFTFENFNTSALTFRRMFTAWVHINRRKEILWTIFDTLDLDLFRTLSPGIIHCVLNYKRRITCIFTRENFNCHNLIQL